MVFQNLPELLEFSSRLLASFERVAAEAPHELHTCFRKEEFARL